MRWRAAAAIAALAVGCAVPVAQAQTPDTGITDSHYWLGSRGPDELELSLLSATEARVGETLKLQLRIHNPTESAVDDLQITSRRSTAVNSTTQARQELAAGSFPYYGATLGAGKLEPGESRELTVEVPTALGEDSTLAITEPGAYPLLFTLTGTRGGQAASFAEERTILDFQGEETAPDDEGEHSFSLVYPVTAEVDVVPGDTGGEELILESEQLAEQLSPGGRLDQLLDAYLQHDLHGSGCMALDPALVDAADRMSAGYTVNETRPSTAKHPTRLRDSWFSSADSDRGTPGAGAQDAAAWLEKLKKVDCRMLMPWANADTDAVAKVGNEWLTHEAVEQGADTIERILGAPLSTQLTAPASGTSEHAMSVPLLVADNSEWAGKAATFDASLGALLAQTGSKPQTTGYSNPELRYDFSIDSEQARALTAGASISVASAQEETVAKLPNYQDPAAARSVMEAAQRLLDTGRLQPRPVTALEVEEGSGSPGSPYPDPSAFHDAEITQVTQQARYTDELMSIMVNDPSIAMTRYDFTAPLRHDLLTALSATGRSSLHGFPTSVTQSRSRLEKNADMLRELRASVSLIPPGNVYTRVSESSPLLIVAENGLPLPVDAHLAYDAPDGATLNTQNMIHIPAKGSITVSMTADLPSNADQTSLRLWLATPSEHLISDPIDITVQTRAGIVSVYGVGAIAALALALAALFRLGKRKKKKSHG
ncbi:hypothetical protein [Corynebacterium aurimucosum]|uniref:Putative membrane protein n=1 Tax=Corynebacterium aurimucosum (strain ATCC 700975 / DSM 44827 / CIP 107346 / CN-1) TaxID=548476 RepID=C3PL00_CORA7|nr:hypothetical protein [Corynebacterium aurimucosum]ACP34116.1 putative membrane protein [Corynebacterium aurimucosum ATCC 700975]QQU94183.1 hypothetical protein I6I67_05875 [Corynebacterium aurimucosum]